MVRFAPAPRHAGGVVVGEDLNSRMPLINSGGVRQTPWSEGQNVRHLEPMGFIKFDVLGLSTLKNDRGGNLSYLTPTSQCREPQPSKTSRPFTIRTYIQT